VLLFKKVFIVFIYLVVEGGDLIVVPAYECRTYHNVGRTPGHILTILAGESWVQFDKKVVEDARKFGAVCDDWGTLTHDLEGRPIVNLNAEHGKDFKLKEEFVVTSAEDMGKNTFRQTGQLGKLKMPSIPEGIRLEMVTVPKDTCARVQLTSLFISIVVVKGQGLVQGIQILNTWDTAHLTYVQGVSEPEIRLEGLGDGANTFLIVYSDGQET